MPEVPLGPAPPDAAAAGAATPAAIAAAAPAVTPPAAAPAACPAPAETASELNWLNVLATGAGSAEAGMEARYRLWTIPIGQNSSLIRRPRDTGGNSGAGVLSPEKANVADFGQFFEKTADCVYYRQGIQAIGLP